jgi:hypothetical protein
VTCTCSKHAWNPPCPKHGTLREPIQPQARDADVRAVAMVGLAERPGQAARRGRLPAPPASPQRLAYAADLLRWSRTCKEHGLVWAEWNQR